MMAAKGLGRLLAVFGSEGLKIAESREIIDMMGNSPVGDQPGVVVIGPMDWARQNATDVLLKTLEEFDPRVVCPVLWAHDESEVSPTIRSRCLRQWCPGEIVTDEEVATRARDLVNEALDRRYASVVELLKEQDPRQMLEAASDILRERGIDKTTRRLWESVRAASKAREPSMNEVVAAFLLEAQT